MDSMTIIAVASIVIAGIKGEEKEQLTSVVKASHTPVIVRTTSDLTPTLTASTEHVISRK
jgi:hypothetical protein